VSEGPLAVNVGRGGGDVHARTARTQDRAAGRALGRRLSVLLCAGPRGGGGYQPPALCGRRSHGASQGALLARRTPLRALSAGTIRWISTNASLALGSVALWVNLAIRNAGANSVAVLIPLRLVASVVGEQVLPPHVQLTSGLVISGIVLIVVVIRGYFALQVWLSLRLQDQQSDCSQHVPRGSSSTSSPRGALLRTPSAWDL